MTTNTHNNGGSTMTNNYITQALATRQSLEELAATVRDDSLLSADGKREAVDKAWSEAEATLRHLEQQHRAASQGEMERLSRSIYSPPAVNGSLFGTYRDALDRAERAAAQEDTGRLAALMATAKRTGDILQQHAVFVVAEQTGRPEDLLAAKSWLDDHPDKAEAYQQLAALESPDVVSWEGMEVARAFNLPRKPEFVLGGTQIGWDA